MSLVKRTGVLLAACLVALALVFALGACSSEESSSSSSSESTETESTDTESEDTESEDTESDDTASEDTEATSTSKVGAQTYAEWNEEYPYIWPTFAQSLYYPELKGQGHDGAAEYSHYAEWSKDCLEGIWRDYDRSDTSTLMCIGDCLACRTTAFDEFFDEYGYAAFDMTVEDLNYDGGYTAGSDTPYYDCFCCHTDSESLTVEPGVFAKCLIEKWDGYDELPADDKVCAQCHNFVGLLIYELDGENKTVDDLDPYRYGTLPDGLAKSGEEDGINEAWVMWALAADLGSIESAGSNSSFEQHVNSEHYAVGLTCVDCHSEEVTDEETGTTFMSHNFSSSPLRSEEKLEWCIECHTEFSTTDEMVDYYYEKKDALWPEVVNAGDLKLEARTMLQEANQAAGDNVSDELAEIQDTYYLATNYYDWVCGFGEVFDNMEQIYEGLSVHDYTDQMTYITEAETMFQEVIDGLNALS